MGRAKITALITIQQEPMLISSRHNRGGTIFSCSLIVGRPLTPIIKECSAVNVAIQQSNAGTEILPKHTPD